MTESPIDDPHLETNSNLRISHDNLYSNGEQVVNTETFKGREIDRSDTPATLLTEYIIQPDITILCDQCCMYITINRMHYHHAYHRALVTFGYKHPQKPTDLKSLVQKRSTLLKNVRAEATRENHICPGDVRKIDAAFEVLKNNLEDVNEEMSFIDQNVDASFKSITLNCSLDCVNAVGISVSENSRWKQGMEDACVYQDYFGEDRNKCYLAIFDGYHGSVAAERSSKELHQLLLTEMSKFDPKIKSTIARNFAGSHSARTDYEKLRPKTRESFRENLHQDSTEIVQNILDLCYEKYDEMMKERGNNLNKKEKERQPRYPRMEQIHNAFKKAYLLMDILLSHGKDERSKVRWSGTSALTVIIEDVKSDKSGSENNVASSKKEFDESGKTEEVEEPHEPLGVIHIANAGNSRALLVHGNKTYRLTRDHTLKNPQERKRVLRSGGNFNISEKGSRVNGVLSVTRGLGNHGDKRLKDCVITDPFVTTVPIDKSSQFLVLASNGVWEVFSDEEVASLLVKMLPDRWIPPPSRMSESLLPLLQGNMGNMSGACNEKHEQGSVLSEDHCKFSEQPGLATQPVECHDENLDADKEKIQMTATQEADEECLSLPDFSEGRESTTPAAESEPRKELAKLMSEYLTQAALLAGAKENVTVMVVLLPACGI